MVPNCVYSFIFGPKKEGITKVHRLCTNRDDKPCLLKTQHLTDTKVTRIWLYILSFF